MSSPREHRALELLASVPRVDLLWESGTYTMDTVLKKFSLPTVIRCDPRHFESHTDNLSFNMAQPLLLCRPRTVIKLMANNVTFDAENKRYVSMGEPLLIPEDYKGWFAVLGKPDAITTAKTVPIFNTIQSLAEYGATQFLIAGAENINGLQLNPQDPQKRPDNRTLVSGDVLRVTGTYMATIKYTKKRLLKDKIIARDEKLLKCIDETDREVFIPFAATGRFHVISSSKHNIEIPMAQLHNINEFPCVLKLIHGRIPSTPCCFTGTLIFYSGFTEHSVVSATVFNVRNILLEIPVDSVLQYHVVQNTTALLQNKGYKDAISLCKEQSDIYMRQMKVALVMPEIADDSDSCSDYSSTPDESPPPTPQTRDSKKIKYKKPIKGIRDYERAVLPQAWKTAHQKMLSQMIPIKSNSAVRLCFGTNALSIPVDSHGSLRFNCPNTNRFDSSEANRPTETFNSFHENFKYRQPPASSGTSVASDTTGHYSVPRINRERTLSDDEHKSENGGVFYENMTLLRKVSMSEVQDLPPPVPCRPTNRQLLYISDDISVNSCADDLPLGASATSTMGSKSSVCGASDSGFGVEPDDGTSNMGKTPLSILSVNDIILRLRDLGVREDSLDTIKADKVDGKLLQTLNVECLQEYFPSLRKLDLRKVALLIEGMWSPKR